MTQGRHRSVEGMPVRFGNTFCAVKEELRQRFEDSEDPGCVTAKRKSGGNPRTLRRRPALD
jgi:hypothetical protein